MTMAFMALQAIRCAQQTNPCEPSSAKETAMDIDDLQPRKKLPEIRAGRRYFRAVRA